MTLTQNAGEIAINCPFCVERGKRPDRGKHCYVNPAKQVFFCFRCEAAGTASKLDLSGIPAMYRNSASRRTLPADMPATSELSDFAYQYLTQERGIGWWLINSLPIYTTEKGILFQFPTEPYWQERRWRGKPRWLGPGGRKHHVTYLVEPSNSERVVIVEGIGDALKVATAGYCAAAVLGSRVMAAQAEALADRYGFTDAVLMLDADVPAAKLADAARTLEAHFEQVRVASLRAGDPGEKSVELLRELIR